jgi:Raf kinase inhibitor-like YbhB/YbcL family protein
MAFDLSSPAFVNGDPIPAIYACDEQNISPPLHWSGVPSGAKSFALIVDDPDAPAGIWHHWAIYNIPVTVDRLDAAVPASAFSQAINDSGQRGYGGPCPPKGHGTHHYHFRLLALDVPALNLPDGPKVAMVENAVQSHTLAQAELIGLYSR